MLYFREPDSMPDDSPEAITRLLQMAFIAMTYEYVDHAASILERPAGKRDRPRLLAECSPTCP